MVKILVTLLAVVANMFKLGFNRFCNIVLNMVKILVTLLAVVANTFKLGFNRFCNMVLNTQSKYLSRCWLS